MVRQTSMVYGVLWNLDENVQLDKTMRTPIITLSSDKYFVHSIMLLTLDGYIDTYKGLSFQIV